MLGIIDYGAGNLKSLVNALKLLGKEFKILNAPDLQKISVLILPGVGAFGSAIGNLEKLKWIEEIQRWVEKGNPMLGICLGMQLLFDVSEEEGLHEGLKLIRGRIKRFPDMGLPIPHMGWNEVKIVSESENILSDFPFPQYFYFAHSYYAIPEEKVTIGETSYGIIFPSIVGKGNLLGFQFHPEKSGERGLKLLDISLKRLEERC
ncbi:MAG: imidazole glycerol phosphate synthase subunit HisH [Synergistetes bacterium]|nr:MAG: Imidazole glycerol phosphate synthase subunit HisH [bacterium 42_11]MBC7332425.1 imidazole glycerol phosphate synthase subunit HisH [Synergistota bacterium]MDK2871400.1 imidazole glycerol-phosphate synthase subunit HisH [bacterium]